MKYSKRVNIISGLIENCSCLLDVGCDHGYVCILCCENEKASKAVASDINPGPLRKAAANIKLAGLCDRIDTVLSDGMKGISEKFDAVCICGMGGLLIRDILIGGSARLDSVKQMVLGPHSEIASLREYIAYDTPFYIRSETVLKEDGKFYTLLDIKRKSDGCICPDIRRAYLCFGDPALQNDRKTYSDMLRYELEKRKSTLENLGNSEGERAAARKNELSEELHMIGLLLETTGE